MRAPLAAVAASAAALLLAAPALAATDPGAPTQKHTAAGMKLARSLGLRLADLAPGWTREPAPKTEPPPCSLAPDESTLVEVGRVDPTFVWTDTFTRIGSAVDVFRTAAGARTDWRLTTLALLRGCLLENARRSFGAKVAVRVVSAQTLAPPKVGERALHYRVVLEAKQKGAGAKTPPARIVAELVGFGVGRVSVVVHSVAPVALPAAQVSALMKVLSSRLHAGSGAI